ASNFVMAIGWALVLLALVALGIDETFFIRMAQGGIMVNLVMWAFNLFPLPPLDGGRVLAGLLPRGRAQDVLMRIEPFGFFIVLALVLAGVVGTWWLQPLMQFGLKAIGVLVSPFEFLLR
ncbi:MAG TPA: site-2 protease family protein, partial [Dongiaceae bacterium]|nr:site-2 protease family protein [Dongiaceae bacterium]